MKRTLTEFHFRSIYLIGFSGSGKSAIGPMLARKLKCKFFDADDEIEKLARKSISRIFRSRGEKRFRSYETAVINRLAQKSTQEKVVALGGGAFELMRNRRIVAKDGLIVYLSCPIRILQRRLRETSDRPLLGGKEVSGSALYARIRRIVLKRKRNYEKADIRVSTGSNTRDRTVALICVAIASLRGDN